ncbi:LysR family transcriptional regulator [Aestuariirhabdus litorea]|uniref:LysR family transcriptional regulator n=1 Tax=Aestuariirhabdus litorea TaxID=2528527 RepID=A0A3P3VK11_9GAMM|nr:LysR family transcriptional regulator [Aestuariirhabdus litorea]RRJ83071.1 LysR family transcriptional regulator [Aestuariirhabdus litorea]RWW93229.1 LysR family transcriptional regulator [Endozoicomonadaceae bacterium GTF-13]
MRYSFRQLEVFLAAAHTENITRAAERLSMSQSAASSALRELEQQFDIQLFDRVGKRLQLNELGRLLRPQAEALLEQASELEQALAQHRTPGALHVGATLTIGNYLAVGIMSRYMGEQAGARVALEVANTSQVVQRVLNYELDIGLIEGELYHPDLEIIPWREDHLVAFCAPEHRLARVGVLDERALRETPWILREPGSGTRQTFERALHGLVSELDVRLELQHTEAIKRAVEAGLGVGCLSRVALRDAFRRGTLVPLAVPGRDFSRHFYFILHRSKYRSAGISRWIQLCQEYPELL